MKCGKDCRFGGEFLERRFYYISDICGKIHVISMIPGPAVFLLTVMLTLDIVQGYQSTLGRSLSCIFALLRKLSCTKIIFLNMATKVLDLDTCPIFLMSIFAL